MTRLPRNRTARSAVLGLPVRRSASRSHTSRTSSALRRRIVLGLLVVLSLALITVSFRETSEGPLHDAQAAVATRLLRLDKSLDATAKEAEKWKDYPDRGAERRDVRNRCRDVTELYDGDTEPGVPDAVKRAETLAALVPKSKG